jgi:hypothetical protein
MTYSRSGTALELRFNTPWHFGAAVLTQDYVDYIGVDIFGVDEEAIHIKDTGSDWGEAVRTAQLVSGG